MKKGLSVFAFFILICICGAMIGSASESGLSKNAGDLSADRSARISNRESENPLIPMGAITGKPTREQIRKILADYRSVGINQFLIYPRAGCELEYMSEEWLNTCEWVCEEAQKLGFTSIWLYDEYNWPSGTCNKEVMKINPKFEMPQLCVNKDNGEYKVEIRRNPQMSYLMDPDAVDCFIKMTHEKYFARLGKYFGTLIKGIFTDEPDIGYFNRSNRKDVFRMGYYFGLNEDYAKATGGRDLNKDIIEGVKSGTHDFQAVCNRLLGERFRAVYIDRVNKWCLDHKIVFTGHMMNESGTSVALSSNGHALLAIGGMSFPGIDEIFLHNSIESVPGCKLGGTKGAVEWLTFSTGMYAIEKQGNRGGLAELFALGPCEISFTRLIKQIWLASAFGIDHYLLAIAPVDARGNSLKGQYYSVFTTDQPHFSVWSGWGDIAKEAAAFARKDRVCEIAVRYPYFPVDLHEFLIELVQHQCSWRVLLPGEKPDPSAQMIFDFTPQGIKEEKSGTLIENFDSFYKQNLLSGEADRTLVVDKEGKMVNDVFLRRFADGSALVIDFSGKCRSLYWQRFGLKTPFTLQADGTVLLPAWRVSADRPNIIRLELDPKTKEYSFEIAEPIDDLRLIVRQYGGEALMELNGQKISAEDPCSTLPSGFKDLYKEKKLDLAPGKYTIRQTGDAVDYSFLPSGFLSGSFARTAGTDRLFRYREDGKDLQDYVGKLTQTAKIAIPPDVLRISIPIEFGDAEIQIDGKSLGIRLCAPYRWIVPDSARGKTAEITLIRHSSIAPMFGKIRSNVWRERENNQSIPGIVDLIWE
ncbi:MAG: hypothetical protein Q4G69_05335 [Planctomycetia bacterium]|nr:hypothetical protein [Planctomycetia bacterium]